MGRIIDFLMLRDGSTTSGAFFAVNKVQQNSGVLNLSPSKNSISEMNLLTRVS